MQLGPISISWGKKTVGNGTYVVSAGDLADLMSSLDDVLEGCYSDYNLIKLFESIGEIFAPIDEIASRVAGAVFQLRLLKNDEVVYGNKAMNKILESPNPLQNFQELIYEMVVYELVTGKNMLYANVPDTLVFDYKNISALWNLPTYIVELITDLQVKLFTATEIGDIIKGYRIHDGANPITLTPDKVLLSKKIDLDFANKKINGKSPLLAARKAIKNLIAVYAARKAIYLKRGALGFIVSKKSDESGLQALTKPEKEQLIKDWHNSYGVVGKNDRGESKSPIAITNLPVDFVRVAMSIVELQPFEETEQDAAVIYSVLRVPRELMPKTKENTYANKKQASKDLHNNVCIPMANRICQSLSNFFQLRPYGFYLHPSFDHVEELQENKKERSDTDWRNNETNRVKFLHGIITLNDWRTASGLEESANPLYSQLIFEMTPEEIAIIKEVISLKSTGSDKSESDEAKPQQ